MIIRVLALALLLAGCTKLPDGTTGPYWWHPKYQSNAVISTYTRADGTVGLVRTYPRRTMPSTY